MRKQYDAFGRPVEPRAPGTDGRPATARRPADGRRHGAAPEQGRPGGSSVQRDRAGDGRGTVVPDVGGLPSVSGGDPVDGSGAGRGARVLRVAGASGVVLLVLLAIVGALADDDPSTGGTAAERSDLRRVSPVTTDRADRAAQLLRSAMRPGDRVVSVSIASSYASARVVAADGTGGRSLSLDDDGEVRSTPSSSTSRSSRGVPVADVDTAAARRVVAAVRRGLGPGSPGTISSVTAYSYRDEPLRWSASVQGAPEVARSWTADAAGRAVVRARDGAPAPPAGETGPARTPEGLSGRSLLVPANLRSALGALGALPGLQDRTPDEIAVATLNVEPERVLVGVAEGARRRLVSVDAAFGLDPSGTSGGAGDATVPLSEIDASGPARALRTIGRRLSTDAARQVGSVSLATVRTASGEERPGWFLVLDGEGDDRVWRASLDGRLVGRSGDELTP